MRQKSKKPFRVCVDGTLLSTHDKPLIKSFIFLCTRVMILELFVPREIIYKQSLPTACTIMDREKILKRHAYNKDMYEKIDFERKQYEKTSQFETIQYIDRKRQKIFDKFLLELQRHESLQKAIQSHCTKTMNQLSQEGMDKHGCEQIMGYYREAFLVENERCIVIFDFKSKYLSESFGKLCEKLERLRHENYHDNKSIEKACDHQSKLMEKMGDRYNDWRRVLLQENFDDNVKKPVFVYVPDKKYQEREIKYEEKLPEACTIMERKYILKTYAYDEKRYDKEDSRKNKQKKTTEFKIIQDIDKQRQIITENLFRKLERHKGVLEYIQRIYENTLCRLQEQGVNEGDIGNIRNCYCDAFLIEKNRFIHVFESDFTTLSISVYKFQDTLKKLDILDTKLTFLQSSRERQIKLCEKLQKTCREWQDLLIHEEFDDTVEGLYYSLSRDKQLYKDFKHE